MENKEEAKATKEGKSENDEAIAKTKWKRAHKEMAQTKN